ncbi:MAG: methyltransferase domain-containing protein [Sphingomonadaceae bacterium]|nr:methyltransferase domain-containing protein [Altererythrobacter sp.]MCP5391390.1 methyltransferase domain-containing protein [Sphingomonadaceae bacterium]MCP5393619.1 methyltransferase domain-containing protein [Sphingomonadaceae bacterium]
MVKRQTHSRSWGDFWAANAASGGGGCLPSAWQAIDAAQRKVWKRAAQHLPRKARMLDLATGDGRVMAAILAERPDVKATGVDLAPVLPPPPTGTKVRAGVAMEDLPFHDNSYAAVTSQFGFEYGQADRVAAETARVLQPDGKVFLLTHRIDGPILAHNLARRRQIIWAIEEEDLIGVAKRSLALRSSNLTALPQKILQAPEQGARRFGPRSAAWEIAEAVRQTMDLGRTDKPSSVAHLLDTIREKARNELGRIASLDAACQTTANTRQFEDDLAKGGLEQVSIKPVSEDGSGVPFADFRILRILN